MKDYSELLGGGLLALAILAVVLLVPCRPANAQGQTQANVTGEVTDASKMPIAGVTVTLLEVDTGQIWNAPTDSQGHFCVPLLPVGNFRLTIERSGFQKPVVENVARGVGATVQTNVTLQVGQLSQQVEVRVQAPPYQATNATTGSTIGESQISELPINGRDYARLRLLAPGASLRSSSISDLSFNGLELESNTFSIDGIDSTRLDYSFIANGSGRGGRLFTDSMSSIGEFAIQTGTYGAQFGRSADAYVNIVSKSGSNNIHGSVWEYDRNTIFDARNYFSATNSMNTRPR